MLKRIVTLCLLFSPPILAKPLPSDVHISVFSTFAYPIQNQQLAHSVYLLDSVEQWEEQFSHTLSSDPKQAETEAKNRLQAPEAQNRLRELQQVYQSVIQGWQEGIRKVPAVLFESKKLGKSVVYGISDIKQAMTLWENWAKQQKREE